MFYNNHVGLKLCIIKGGVFWVTASYKLSAGTHLSEHQSTDLDLSETDAGVWD